MTDASPSSARGAVLPAARMAPGSARATGGWTETGEEAPSLRAWVAAGVLTILIAFGGFFGWAFAAALDSAVLAHGTVIVDSRRKTITHHEGGILKEILVNEGDRVKADDVLFRLDESFARSTVDQLRSQKLAALARLARLRAELDGATAIRWPEELEQEVPWIDSIVAAETHLFRSRSEEHAARLEILGKRIEQYTKMSRSLDLQIQANTRQLALVRDQLREVRALFEKGYERKPRVIELEVQVSKLEADASELAARRAEAEQLAATARLEIATTNTERQSRIAAEIQEAQLTLVDVADRMIAAADVLRRVEIRAPQDGVITNLRVHTVGSSVASGEPIVDIVPFDDDLVVEIRVDPRDIDSVYVGLPVQVRLTAYNQRTLPPLDGRLSYVAADQLVDDQTGQPFFVGRVSIDPDSLAETEGVTLHPGMPAEAIIVTGERRAIDYLIAPIADSMRRAFKEE